MMYVYFVQTGDAIKVGVASHLRNRMVNLQVGNPHKVEILHSISSSTEEEARKIESEIHELFIRTHLNGEWFHANQFMIDFIRHIKDNGWEAHTEWRDGLGSLDSIGQVLSGGPPWFTSLPLPWAACSNKPHQGSCCQALDDAACRIDQTIS